MTTDRFIPPAAESLPEGALDSATEGANRLDAWALDPRGRNFLAHALVQLARDGWLRTAPAAVPVPPPADQTTTGSGRAAEAELYVLLRKAGEPRDEAQALIDRHRDAVMAFLPEQTDRAAIARVRALHEQYAFGNDPADYCAHCNQISSAWIPWPCPTVQALDAELRRVAAEEQPAETQPRRGDSFEAWLKAQRDAAADYPEAYQAADGLLDLYRLHADTGTPLGEHVCEARGVGDCDCLERPAVGEQPETQETPVLPCNYWTLTRTEHTPHRWEPQPGMDPVHCPGFGSTPE